MFNALQNHSGKLNSDIVQRIIGEKKPDELLYRTASSTLGLT